MVFEIKVKNGLDRRKWIVKENQTRLDVVKAIGGSFSPMTAGAMEVGGKFKALRVDVQVRRVQ